MKNRDWLVAAGKLAEKLPDDGDWIYTQVEYRDLIVAFADRSGRYVPVYGYSTGDMREIELGFDRPVAAITQFHDRLVMATNETVPDFIETNLGENDT